MNCKVGRDTLDRVGNTIASFEPFGSRITFSRMIGKNGISHYDLHFPNFYLHLSGAGLSAFLMPLLYHIFAVLASVAIFSFAELCGFRQNRN